MLKRDRKEGQKKLFIAKKNKRKMAAFKRYEWKSDSREIKQSNAQRTQQCSVNTTLPNAVKESLHQHEWCAHFPKRSLQGGISVRR